MHKQKAIFSSYHVVFMYLDVYKCVTVLVPHAILLRPCQCRIWSLTFVHSSFLQNANETTHNFLECVL